ncbi:hypothetical protein KF728_02100 [Candidatus Obscuribacterales bacterium]|nr:hypothetical protein [Candidatus Obscuribacterales bacterium]
MTKPRRLFLRFAIGGLCCVTSCITASAASTQNPVDLRKDGTPRFAGLVYQATGNWFSIKGTQKLRITTGDAIPYGARLVHEGPNARITGWLINNENFECPGGKYDGIKLEPLAPVKNTKPWWLVGLDWLTAPVGDWIKPIARSTDGFATRFKDAIVSIQDNRIDITNCFAALPPDERKSIQFVRLASVPQNESSQSRLLEVTWTDSGQASVEASGLTNGVFILTELDKTELHEEKENTCCIALCEPGQMKMLNENYARANAAMNAVAPSAKLEQIMRAYMVSISSTASAAEPPAETSPTSPTGTPPSTTPSTATNEGQ